MKPSDELRHHRLALVHRVDDVQLGDAAMREFARDEGVRDDAGHLAAGLERRVGEHAHQPDVAAAVDEADLTCGQRARRARARRRQTQD